jgi:hypothetical protein
VNEVQAMERVTGVLDTTEKMRTAVFASVTLDGGACINNGQFSALAVTLTLSRGTTAITANLAPAGFQHLLQPQAWLCRV